MKQAIVLSVTNTNEGPLFVNQTAEYDVTEFVRNLFPLFGVVESTAAASIYESLGSPLNQVNAILGECQAFLQTLAAIYERLTRITAIYKCPTYPLLDAFPGRSYKVAIFFAPY
jgi:hypothetical protein